jgi:hypothetical protein
MKGAAVAVASCKKIGCGVTLPPWPSASASSSPSSSDTAAAAAALSYEAPSFWETTSTRRSLDRIGFSVTSSEEEEEEDGEDRLATGEGTDRYKQRLANLSGFVLSRRRLFFFMDVVRARFHRLSFEIPDSFVGADSYCPVQAPREFHSGAGICGRDRRRDPSVVAGAAAAAAAASATTNNSSNSSCTNALNRIEGGPAPPTLRSVGALGSLENKRERKPAVGATRRIVHGFSMVKKVDWDDGNETWHDTQNSLPPNELERWWLCELDIVDDDAHATY